MNAPHPDDERLSAAFDGHDPEALAHAEGCASCTSRLAAFDEVARLVGAPVAAPSPDAAVGAALRAATVVPLRRRRSPLPLAIAAALVVVMGAVAVLTGRGDEPHLGATSEDADTAMSPTSGHPDLGDQADAGALAERLRAVVEPPPAAAAGDSATASKETLEMSPAEGSAQRSSAGAGPRTPCGATAVQEYGAGLGPLVYQASLRWQGTPAVALVYRVAADTTGPIDHRVLVMAREGCALLVAQSF